MSLGRLTSTGAFKPTPNWARPDVYQDWLSQLSTRDRKATFRAMNAAIDHTDVVRAQYVVCAEGDEWHPVYAPVFEAMGHSRELAGKFIGLILWEVMTTRTEDWVFHKIDKTIVDEHNLVEDIRVMEYFRVHNFPKPGRWRENSKTQGGAA